MHILITSDLHYGVSDEGNAAVEALARHACDDPADVLLIGGDIASDRPSLEACLRLFERFEGRKLAVPGNHDVWLDPDEPGDSWSLHDGLVPELFARHGFHPLHVEPHTTGGVGFVGSMGWYDYSFRDDIGIDLACYEQKTLPGAYGPLWNDAHYARFDASDRDVTACLLERFAAQLEAVSDAETTVALVHHVVTKRLLVHPRFLVPTRWRFANAFLGSERFAELIAAAPAVAQTFCGHIHREKTVREGDQAFVTIGGGYRHKQLVRATPRHVLETRMFT